VRAPRARARMYTCAYVTLCKRSARRMYMCVYMTLCKRSARRRGAPGASQLPPEAVAPEAVSEGADGKHQIG
jgi:hypothetical protein